MCMFDLFIALAAFNPILSNSLDMWLSARRPMHYPYMRNALQRDEGFCKHINTITFI